METTESEVLAEVISDCAKADGWANLAEIGVLLRKKISHTANCRNISSDFLRLSN